MADIDAVNERLNNLVSLLQAVGVGGVSRDDMDRVSKSLTNGSTSQLNEQQIEQLIRQLQIAQDSAPQSTSNFGREPPASSHRQTKAHPSQQSQVQADDDDDDDESDSFDEDADYPMVGYGVSDDVSILSDLTTPTVVSSLHVPEEEHYGDGSLPPMVIGGTGNVPSMLIAAPKRKNLVQPQRPGGGIAPPPARRQSTTTTTRPDRGGAASARLKNYQTTMAKLSEPVLKRGTKKISSSGVASSSSAKKKAPVKKKVTENFSDLVASRGGGGDGWTEAPKSKTPRQAPKKKVSPKTPIDDDGFLVTDGFDVFDNDVNPFKSSAGDLEFGMAADPFNTDFGAFGSFGFAPASRPITASTPAAQPSKLRIKKPTQQTTGLQRKVPSHAKSGEGRSRRTRRASAIS